MTYTKVRVHFYGKCSFRSSDVELQGLEEYAAGEPHDLTALLSHGEGREGQFHFFFLKQADHS